MVMLGSIVTGAPFLGLLGTVWGVMDAFGGMAGAGSASLQGLAPGVSGALLTTVAGLVVAIPSVFGYNYLLQQTPRSRWSSWRTSPAPWPTGSNSNRKPPQTKY